MNKAVGSITGLVIIVVLGVVGFLVTRDTPADRDVQTDTAQTQPESVQQSTPSNAAGTSLAGSDQSGQSDTAAEDPGVQDQNYAIDMFNFGYSIEQIKAAPGDTITIDLSSSNGTHDFVIDELNVRSDTVNTGGNALVTFTIPQSAAGQTYEYYCSIMNHRAQGMVGKLVISE